MKKKIYRKSAFKHGNFQQIHVQFSNVLHGNVKYAVM